MTESPSRWRLADAALCVLAGLLLAFSMPGMGPSALAYIGLIPLLWAIMEVGYKNAFLHGWLAGTVMFLVSMIWVADTVHTYGALSYLLAYPTALLLALYLGLYVGLFGLAVRYMYHRRVPMVLAAPLVWVALEYARAHLMTGLPWNLLGLSLYQSTRITQMADLTGVYGVSWYIVLINACLATLIAPLAGRRPGRRQSFFYNHAAILFLVPICVATYGQVQIASFSLWHQSNPNPDGPIKISLVQPNIPQNIKWNADNLDATLTRLERLTANTAEFNPDLVIWPEASAPLVLERNPMLARRIAAQARNLGADILVGTLSPAPKGAVFNGVERFRADGHHGGRVAKVHLVPFGEYVPLERFLPFVRALTAGIGNVLPGTEPVVMETARGKSAVAICYEIIFPNLVRKRLNGADFIVTVTNDAWFGSSAALQQHFAQAVFRAVENRAYVVRAANTGITGMIDPYGIVQETAAPNTEAVVNTRIDQKFGTTFYAQRGDLFAIGSAIMSLLLLAFAATRTPRKWRPRADDDDPWTN